MMAISSGGGGFGSWLGGIQRSGTPQSGGGMKAKEALWQRMSTCMDPFGVCRGCCRRKQTRLHVLLLVMQDSDLTLTDRVWEALVKTFASQTCAASIFVEEIFTTAHAKLFSTIENLLERISRDTDVKGVL